MVSLEICKNVSIYDQNLRAEQLPISERYWTILAKENLSGVICNLNRTYQITVMIRDYFCIFHMGFPTDPLIVFSLRKVIHIWQ